MKLSSSVTNPRVIKSFGKFKVGVADLSRGYDYSKVVYKGQETKVEIICPKHGSFFQTPYQHVTRGQGCGVCGKNQSTTEDFTAKSKNMYGDKFEYTNTTYTTNDTRVTLTCKVHGDFTTTPINHFSKDGGCKTCRDEKFSLVRRKNTSGFIKQAKALHGNQYGYDLVDYKNNYTKVKVICEKGHVFQVRPEGHLYDKRPTGCKKCQLINQTKTLAQFKSESVKVWGKRFKYNKVIYVNIDTKVVINCKLHGAFKQAPYTHLKGQIGCKKCQDKSTSKPEKELRKYIKKFVKVEANTRKIIEPYELDIYVPSHNLAFEFNGLYHHTERTKPNNYHKMKTNMCKAKGIRLVHIFEDDWRDNKKKIKKFIKHLLGLNKKKTVYARKTVIRDIDVAEARPFLDKHHIQGFGRASTHLGMFFEGKLVAVTSFKKGQSNTYNKDMFELTRHATSKIVIGSLGKMTKFFQRTYHNHIYTFCDNSFFSGDSYLKAGYLEVGEIKPDYKYAVNGQREHKFTWRLKDIKIKKPDVYSKDKSEKEMMLEAKIYRIYDCGKTRFEIT